MPLARNCGRSDERRDSFGKEWGIKYGGPASFNGVCFTRKAVCRTAGWQQSPLCPKHRVWRYAALHSVVYNSSYGTLATSHGWNVLPMLAIKPSLRKQLARHTAHTCFLAIHSYFRENNVNFVRILLYNPSMAALDTLWLLQRNEKANSSPSFVFT
jgi:hypothetical protein